MIGATSLHTRAACDNCGEMPATREGPGGTVLCDGCGAVKPANDDAQGSFCARPLCSRCSEPAFLRVDETNAFCAECWLKIEAHLENDSSFAATTPLGDNVTAAVKPTPGPSAAVTPPSKEPDVLALLFCAPFRGSSDITKGDEHEAHQRHFVNIDRRRPEPEMNFCFDNAKESTHDVEVRIGAAGKGPRLSSPERGRAAASDTADQISSSGDGLGTQQPGSITWSGSDATPAPSGRARNRAICPTVSWNSSSGAPCDALPCRDGGVSVTSTRSPDETNSDSASASPPSTADASSKLATLRQDAVFSSTDPGMCGFDLETDALVSGLEVGWALERRNSSTLRVVAASDSAENSKSNSVASI